MRIGIDVGGTHTDAVLLDADTVVATHKVLTTPDVMTGFYQVLSRLLEGSPQARTAEAIMIGTTQFTNAVVERQQLSPVAAIRLGSPSGRGLPPYVGWPTDIEKVVNGSVFVLRGGFLFDGKPLAGIDESEVATLVDDLAKRGVASVAITSAFSPMDPSPELLVAKRITQRLPQVRMTLSHEIGRIGLLERENAAILNSALLPFADNVCDAIENAVIKSKLACPVFITQNDGTLMDLSYARRFPALTFASGPTNSLRGAARLSGLENAIVIDIGGTTTDIGVLHKGFPRESNRVVEVGGVRTNFRMPDILAIGLGGGSHVTEDGNSVGPRSVGHRLVHEGKVFGGATLTASDIAVAAGQADIGSPSSVAHLRATLVKQVVDNGIEQISRLLDAAVQKVNPGKDQLPIVLVGGGALLVPPSFGGNTRVFRPAYCQVANAIGAAIGQVGAEAERFVSYQRITRVAALDEVRQDAMARAVAAGADTATLRVNDIEEVAIPYMEDGSTRIRVKVIGEVAALSVDDRSGVFS